MSIPGENNCARIKFHEAGTNGFALRYARIRREGPVGEVAGGMRK
jgi:hypothetical protein